MIISIEGNIGSGKTTIFSMIQKKLSNYIGRGRTIAFVDEPVSDWEAIKDNDGKSMLDLLYTDTKTHAFAFQMMAFITRYQKFKNCREQNPEAILISERCLQTDAEVFAKMLKESGNIMDIHYKIYKKWAEELAAEFSPDFYIYVRASPEISFQRVKKRNRQSETTVSLEYLKGCNDKHESWLMGHIDSKKIIVFDANEEFIGDGEHKVESLMKSLNKFVL